MCMDSQPSTARRREQGFTLIEVLVVVAIIGLLSSIAIPALKQAMYKSKRNAAISELKVLRDHMQTYMADVGYYPIWGNLHYVTLAPLAPKYITRASSVLDHLVRKRLSWYISWNIFEDPFDMDVFTSPKSFLIEAQLEYDHGTWFYLTDGSFYIWKDGRLTDINDTLK